LIDRGVGQAFEDAWDQGGSAHVTPFDSRILSTQARDRSRYFPVRGVTRASDPVDFETPGAAAFR
jgi:hypothetical protein